MYKIKQSNMMFENTLRIQCPCNVYFQTAMCKSCVRCTICQLKILSECNVHAMFTFRLQCANLVFDVQYVS